MAGPGKASGEDVPAPKSQSTSPDQLYSTPPGFCSILHRSLCHFLPRDMIKAASDFAAFWASEIYNEGLQVNQWGKGRGKGPPGSRPVEVSSWRFNGTAWMQS